MMDTQIIEKLLNLNKSFYENIATDFSNTRNGPWKGWKQVLEFTQPNKEHVIGDIACGNGRLYGFLKEHLNTPFTYRGYDQSDKLLAEAQKLYQQSNVSFEKRDVLRDLKSIKQTFSLVCAFGITHHIPSYENRLEWFSTLSSLSTEYLCFTIWNFDNDVRFNKSKRNVNKDELNIDETDLEEGDYLLGWANQPVHRYCHAYGAEELRHVDIVLQETGMTLAKTFQADGKTNDLNTYYIYRKTL